MLFTAILLELTVAEVFRFIKDYWFIIVLVSSAIGGQYKLLMARLDKDRHDVDARIDKLLDLAKSDQEKVNSKIDKLADEAKAERADLNKRLSAAEELDRKAYPAFTTLCDDFKKLEEVVKNHHETRFTGIIGNIELFSKLYEAKLDSASQRVNDLEKRLDKIDTKLDKIMEAVMKNNSH
jgi:outer membrane murein-binding lipoprotein Lpp